MTQVLFDRYSALALQVDCECVHMDSDSTGSRPRMMAAIARIDEAIRGAKRWIGAGLKLVVLPEYVLTGPPWGESIPEWLEKGTIAPDGAEVEALAAVADRHGIYLGVNAYETDRHFPGLYFQGSFILDPAGKRILSYRRLISMFAPTPHDVWDRYLDVYGLDGVFPVVDTPIGKLAAIASEEILYPEVARCHAIRGANVFLHSSSEVGAATLTPKQIARRARALENLAFVVSANTARLVGMEIPLDSANGGSDIIDYYGRQLIAASVGASSSATASIDMAGLRAYRASSGMGNLLSRQALGLFAETYAKADIRRQNGLWKNGKVVVPERSYFAEAQADVLQRMTERGLTS
ncbi:MAG: nitrilase [Proteobacteria bacterium]|nr:nitrilase [Pseudomonadota bacterium]